MKPEILNISQGEPEWLNAKLGVISASRVNDILPSRKTGKYKEARQTYMMELLGQIATKSYDEINAKALEWGKLNEVAARAAYEFETGEIVDQVGFIYNLDRRIGCSPDGLIKGKNKGLEIKNPFTSKVHIDFLLNDKIKEEYQDQVQFSMLVTGADAWDFCSFHSKFKSGMLKITTFERDEKIQNMMLEEIHKFMTDMDSAMEKLSLKWGSQWE